MAETPSQETPEARGGGPELLFESRAPGLTGGGVGMSDTLFPGHTFRLLERAEVTTLGLSNVQAFSDQNVFTALYRLDLRDSTPDVVNDSDLVGAVPVHVPAGTSDVTGAVSLTLEPGWYSILAGAGRHGSPAGSSAILISTGTSTTPMSRGPYSMNATTNGQVLQGVTARFFVEGNPLPPAPPPAGTFLLETVRPSAWSDGAWTGINATGFHAVPFELTRETRLGEVGAWMWNGSGQVLAAIVQRSGPGANPPVPTSAAFANAVVGTALITAGGAARTYSGDFDGLELPPGHYALVLGSGMFGAEGSALTTTVEDQIVLDNTLEWWSPAGSWFDVGRRYRFFLKGVQPTVAVAPDPADFGQVELGQTASQTITVTNIDDADVQLSGIGVNGDGFFQFSLGEDVSNCATALLMPQTSCQFTLHFSPSQLGGQSAVLQVFNDGVIDTVESQLAGIGIPPFPVLAFIPDQVDFADVQTGAASEPISVTLHNAGNGDATELAFDLVASAFGVDVSECATTLPAGQSCQVQAQCLPQATGPASGLLSVDAGESVSATLSLQCNGILPPTAAVDPGLLSFEIVTGDSDTRQLAIANLGDVDLQWSLQAVVMEDPAVAGRGIVCDGPAADWLTVDPAAAATLPGGNTSVTVTAATAGLAAGGHAAALCLNSNDPQHPVLAVPVTLIVTAPSLVFDPAEVDFGKVEIGTPGVEMPVILSNQGDAAATGLQLALAARAGAPFVGGFSVDTSDCGDELPAGGGCTVLMTFEPPLLGLVQAQLTANSAEDGMAELALSGRGVTSEDAIFGDRFESP